MHDLNYGNILRGVLSRRDLSLQQAHWAFGQIMDGGWNEAQIAALLAGLAAKGESVDEITGAALAMREHVRRINAGNADVLDTCGTGGTGLSTFNVSTAAALVVAGAGMKVAKHGNRTATRASGSADVLAALGVNIDADDALVEQCLARANVCFCFAVRCHPAMKYAAPVRKALGVRTIFNLLGPLTNPAGARRQLMGVFDAGKTEPIAHVLKALGARRAMVVHAEDGLDEISTTAATQISELKDGHVATRRVQPEDFGLARVSLDRLLVKSAADSAQAVRAILQGDTGPCRDIVLLNAAAALVVSDRAADIPAGLELAARSVDSGAATKALETLVAISNGRGTP